MHHPAAFAVVPDVGIEAFGEQHASKPNRPATRQLGVTETDVAATFSVEILSTLGSGSMVRDAITLLREAPSSCTLDGTDSLG